MGLGRTLISLYTQKSPEAMKLKIYLHLLKVRIAMTAPLPEP